MNTKYGFEFENHKNAIIFLKGIIVTYAKNCGMKHSTTKIESEYYTKGKLFIGNNKYLEQDWINVVHVIYNRIRHNRPHSKNLGTDQKYLDLSYSSKTLKESLKEILGDGYEKMWSWEVANV